MLEQMIESKNGGKETAKRFKFLGTTFVLIVSFAFSGVLWSLFAKDFSVSERGMNLSMLVAPVPVPENKPQPPAPARKLPATDVKNTVNETVRRENILRVEESPKTPDKIAVVPGANKARPDAPFSISKNVQTESNFQSSAVTSIGNNAGGSSENGNGIGNENSAKETVKETVKTTIPPPPPLQEKAKTVKKDAVVSGGVLNGKAISLPQPAYSALAKMANAQGDVHVQILISEDGAVLSANAVSGHPLLRAESERAARSAKFSPTRLSGQPVKIRGTIVYKFSK